MSIIDLGMQRARTFVLLLVLLLFAGASAYSSIPKESAPDIAIPIVYVSTSLQGISPFDAERLLVKPIEKAVSQVEGLKELRSTSYLGGGNVVLEFDAGFDVEQALRDVREKIDEVKGDLPADANDPNVNEVNFSLFPVMQISLSGEIDSRILLDYAQILQEEIEKLSQVLRVDLDGDRDEVVEVTINPVKLQSYNVTPDQVIRAIASSNLLVAAGNLEGESGSFAIKVPSLIESIDDLKRFPIISSGESVLVLEDITDIKRTFKDVRAFSRLNGESALTLSVVKRTGENIIQTSLDAHALVDEVTKDWPQAISVVITQDEADNIRSSLSSLQNSVISAIILVMIVILATLGLRPSLLVGVAIPGSFLSGILVMNLLGVTLNFVVLFGLIISVGLLVDGAIVVAEYAERKIDEGYSKIEAFALASKKMAWPIIASTGTTLAAFMPLLFWPGLVGEFMGYLPLTVIFILSSSLVMALFFLPIVGGHFAAILRCAVAVICGFIVYSLAGAVLGILLPPLAGLGKILGFAYGVWRGYKVIGPWIDEKIEGGLADDEHRVSVVVNEDRRDMIDIDKTSRFTQSYLSFLENWALKYPRRILAGAVIAMVLSWVLYGVLGRGVEFFPSGDSEQAVLLVHARGNYSTTERDVLVQQVEKAVLELKQEKNEIENITASAGTVSDGRDVAEDVIGVINLEYVDWHDRRKSDEIVKDIDAKMSLIPGIYVEVRQGENGPPTGQPISIQLSSDSFDDLNRAAIIVREHLEKSPGIRDIEDSISPPGIEWQLNVDREEAYKYDINISTIGNYVRLITNGITLSSYRPDDSNDEIDIIMRLPKSVRSTEQLDSLRIATSGGDVPMGNFVTREAVLKTPLVRRVDQKRISFVRSDLQRGVLAANKIEELQEEIPQLGLPASVSFEFTGENADQAEASAFLQKAFGIALFVMALILLTQFNSFYQCFLILSAVIMSTIGVMLGLLIIRQPFGIIMSGIGVISLAGIVVNNNIVLIDTFNTLMKRTKGDYYQSIIQTCAQRLRPVLMTTGTTMLGLIPLVIRLEIDFVNRGYALDDPSTAFWQQLAAAIVFGMGFATVLTLIVTPSGLFLFNHYFEKQREAEKTNQGKSANPNIGAAVKS